MAALSFCATSMLLGQIISHYRVIEKLGGGAAAVAFQ